jgi:hypothetical protein
MLRKNSMLTAVVCAAAVAGASASAAFAGEVKGPPTGSDPNTNFNTAATSHANSVCVFSGLNDNPGSTDPNNPGGHVQTPADGPPGAPGHGIPGVFPIGCKGGSNLDRLPPH